MGELGDKLRKGTKDIEATVKTEARSWLNREVCEVKDGSQTNRKME